MKIGDLAARVGINTSAIRYYERMGLIPAPPRRSGRRIYDRRAVDRLVFIGALQRAGFSLAEIEPLLSGLDSRRKASARWRRAAERKLAELDERIEALETSRRLLADAVDCACAGRPQDCALLAGRSEDTGAGELA